MHREAERHVVRFAEAFDHGRIDAVLDHHRLERRARQNRLSDHSVVPGHDLALGIEPDLGAVYVRRAVVAALDIVLAAPHHLDRAALAGSIPRLRDVDGFNKVIRSRHGTPPEAAAGHHGIQGNLLDLQAGCARNRALVHGLELRAGPDDAGVRLQVDDAIERLHRRMGQIGKFIDSRDLFRRAGQLRYIGVLGHSAWLARKYLIGGELGVARDLFVPAGVPVDGERLARLQGLPVTLGDHGYAAAAAIGRDLEHVDHALDGLGLGGIELGHLGAEHGRARHHGHLHAGEIIIDPETLLAGRFGARIEAWCGLADNGEILGVFQHHLFRHRLRHGRIGQRAEARLLSRRAIDHARAYLDLIRRDLPLRSGSRHQHGTRPRPDLAVLHERVGHRAGTAGDLDTEQRVLVGIAGGRQFAPDLAPVRIEFFGDQHGQCRLHPLAELQPVHHDGHAVIRADVQESVRRIHRLRLLRQRETVAAGDVKTQYQAAARYGSRFEKSTARDSTTAAIRPSRAIRAAGAGIHPFDTHDGLLSIFS